MADEDDLELDTIDVIEEVTEDIDDEGNLIIEDTTVYIDEATGDALVDDITVVETPDGIITADEVIFAVPGDQGDDEAADAEA